MKFEYKNWFLEKPKFPTHRIPNTTSLWHVMDTEELFNLNFQKYPNSQHLQNYKQFPIKYQYNNYGFRTPDNFDLETIGNVYLGCSHTFGIGLHLEDTWVYKLNKEIGGKNYNIAEPGSGIMTQYRYLNYFKDKIKFNNVFHYLPDEDWTRYEKISNDEFETIYHTDAISKDLFNFLYDDKTIHLINYVFIDAIRYMLNTRGINYYLVTKTRNVDKVDPYSKKLKPARDLAHYYVEDHDEIFGMFHHKYLNKITDNIDNNILLNEIDSRTIKFI